MRSAITIPAPYAANDNQRAEAPRAPGVVGGIKSLLCDHCGAFEAVDDGFCADCAPMHRTGVFTRVRRDND